jgi:hypothetical protein
MSQVTRAATREGLRTATPAEAPRIQVVTSAAVTRIQVVADIRRQRRADTRAAVVIPTLVVDTLTRVERTSPRVTAKS